MSIRPAIKAYHGNANRIGDGMHSAAALLMLQLLRRIEDLEARVEEEEEGVGGINCHQ